ncbi:acyltransferase [Candidatus Nitrosotenuis sp. DW1]|uniref:acyltransferase n=1 Tax=Candidatus Nitrosotenuis sp. DW1 TaxID=2259672 RepID=UPI0015C6C5F7|nr:acyltransferase [Candidatus Nitrosotenuis sp. DW1]QLH09705.1 acyltransferase [Candidatus Nitrosotenuis sp. DW1]
MKDEQGAFSTNEVELLEYYGLRGSLGKTRLRFKFLRTWILHCLAYSSPDSGFAIKMQRMRGVEIGKNCHLSPYVLIDLLYPQLIKIENNVTIGSNTLIFAHVNPTANPFLKKLYPRKVKPVNIKSGAVLFPGCIITAGVTIGENSMIGAGSVIAEDIPDHCIVIGNPARIVKKIDH